MDTRLIFRDRRNSIKTEGGTQTVSPVELMGYLCRMKGYRERQIRPVICQENPLRRVRRPYYKQTHVDEKNILRRSGDGLFRN